MQISGIVISQLASQISSGVSLHGGAAGWNGRSILIPGISGAGKSSLTAWFVDKGFDYLTDEFAVLLNDSVALTGLPRALMLKPRADAIVSSFPRLGSSPKKQANHILMLRPEYGLSSAAHLPCGLIVFPNFQAGAQLSIAPMSAAQVSIQLMATVANSDVLADGGFATINDFVRTVPAVVVTYGAFEQLDGVMDAFVKLVLDSNISPAQMRRITTAFESISAPSDIQPQRYSVPSATPRRPDAKLTIGMATYDDYDGVYFSLQALRLYHPEIVDHVEFIVIDNHPNGRCAASLKALDSQIPNYRYIPEPTRLGTAVKECVFAEATGEFVLCMDCHVLIAPGGVNRLLTYFQDNPETSDLLQGPLIRDDLRTLATHLRDEWRGGMYGVWDNNGLAEDLDAPPFEIPMQGLGLFACRRTAWPGFHHAFRGFGGEEGYLHQKFRRAGGRTLCLPFLRWMHRFDRPMSVPYRLTWEDRIWNYLVGFGEVGLPISEVEKHFHDFLGEHGTRLIESTKQALLNSGHSH